jgi:uncharacterized protein (TIGR03382 family)
VISVGGTKLVKDGSARGFSETAWSMGGSGCSLSIAKPSHQSTSPCKYKASTDIAAVGDPATGVAVYTVRGWQVLGGTSAAAPLVAAIFASTNNGGMTGAAIAAHSDLFHDVTTGSNGSCGSLLCNAAVGWDGPTGYGTPDGQKLATYHPPELTTGGCAATGEPAEIVLALGLAPLVVRRRRRQSRCTAAKSGS